MAERGDDRLGIIGERGDKGPQHLQPRWERQLRPARLRRAQTGAQRGYSGRIERLDMIIGAAGARIGDGERAEERDRCHDERTLAAAKPLCEGLMVRKIAGKCVCWRSRCGLG